MFISIKPPVKLVLLDDVLLKVTVPKSVSMMLSELLYFKELIFRGCFTFPVAEIFAFTIQGPSIASTEVFEKASQ